MEYKGSTNCSILSENEFLCEWRFTTKEIPSKPYVSDLFGKSLCQEFSGVQLAVVRDDLQQTVRFFLFLYGCEVRSGSKITFSACFMRNDSPVYKISCSEMCHDLRPSLKLLEMHSSSGIFDNDNDHYCYEGRLIDFEKNYRLELKMKLHEELPPMPSHSNKNEENNGAFSTTFKNPKNELNLEYPKELIRDLKFLVTSGYMCDLEIRIDESILHAHKSILCVRSPVFKKMIEQDCIGSSSNSIVITDCSVSPFEKFLEYLYTGELEDRTMDNVLLLYSLGGKYDVRALRETCSIILQNKLSSESVEDIANTVCNVLKLAESQSDSRLKGLATLFIVSNFPVVSEKQSWKDLMKSNFEQTSKILAIVDAPADTPHHRKRRVRKNRSKVQNNI